MTTLHLHSDMPLPDAAVLAAGELTTPVLLVDPRDALDIAAELTSLVGAVRYAVKAGPHQPLLDALSAAGHGYDVASPAEAGLVSVPSDRLICANPALALADAAALMASGVRLFVVDALDPALALIAQAHLIDAPLELLVRLDLADATAHLNLASKFGVPVADAPELAGSIRASGGHVIGLAFHLGSQASSAVAAHSASSVALTLAGEFGLGDPVIDVGGGFPAPYVGAPDWRPFAEALGAPLKGRARVLCEPGRLLASAGSVLVASVISVAQRGPRRVAHLDAGAYHGLLEFSGLLGAPFRTPLSALTAVGGPEELVHLVGPTCDSMDRIFDGPVLLPRLAVGDRVLFHLAGAYCTSCSSPFNGFAVPYAVGLACA